MTQLLSSFWTIRAACAARVTWRDSLINAHLCLDREAHLLFVFGSERHAGRNVKIKSSVRCLTRLFTAVDKNVILLQSTTKSRQRGRHAHENPPADDPVTCQTDSSGRRHVSPFVDDSTAPSSSTVATRPTTAWLSLTVILHAIVAERERLPNWTATKTAERSSAAERQPSTPRRIRSYIALLAAAGCR